MRYVYIGLRKLWAQPTSVGMNIVAMGFMWYGIIYCGSHFPPCRSTLRLPSDIYKADFRFAPSQWETALLCNHVSHWLGVSLERNWCHHHFAWLWWTKTSHNIFSQTHMLFKSRLTLGLHRRRRVLSSAIASVCPPVCPSRTTLLL